HAEDRHDQPAGRYRLPASGPAASLLAPGLRPGAGPLALLLAHVCSFRSAQVGNRSSSSRSSPSVNRLSQRATILPSSPIRNAHGSFSSSLRYSHSAAASLTVLFSKSRHTSTWMNSARSPYSAVRSWTRSVTGPQNRLTQNTGVENTTSAGRPRRIASAIVVW